MRKAKSPQVRGGRLLILGGALALLAWGIAPRGRADKPAPAGLAAEYAAQVRPLLTRYCLACHSHKKPKGDLNLERFASLDEVRKDPKAWKAVLEKLENNEMPPGKRPQPRPEERKRLVAWVRGFLGDEARARAGDPGRVTLRRLSNAEYDNTVRDLTGVDLRPARDFPGDGAAGEGFTNAGDGLVMSPTLLGKYWNAAKGIAAHAVLLPEGFRYSPSLTRRDWTDEAKARLRAFYQQVNRGLNDGRLDLVPHLAATVRYRAELASGKLTPEAVAAREKLSPKYLRVLWQTLTGREPSLPLDRLRAHWRRAAPRDVEALAAEVRDWQALLWKFNRIGSYMSPVWQEGVNPGLAESHTLRLKPVLKPDQKEVVLYLAARDLTHDKAGPLVVWRRPRLEGGKQAPRLLRDLLLPEGSPRLGKEKVPFGRHSRGGPVEGASLVVRAPSVLEIRLPAALVRDREFVVEGRLDSADRDGLVQFEVATNPPDPARPLGGAAPCVAGADLRRADPKTLARGFEAFRRCFPIYLYHAKIVPDDEIICLRLFCREDDHLVRLFLDKGQARQLDRLWAELRFISRQPLTEFKNYPTFMGFVSQDGKAAAAHVAAVIREPVRRRAAEFEKELTAAEPRQLEALLDFAARAYRRPLNEKERAELPRLYRALRQKGMDHEEAFRTTLARVLISPSFLYRVERPAAGKEARPVSDWELATRLSYFLWATLPDEELRRAAAAGRLSDPAVLTAQATRMLRDPKARGLATEFAAQWLHVRDLRENREKNEKLFPTFDDKLREALFEETVRYFQDLFQSDRPVLDILDGDATFLNETLARHYGIPGVTGPQWRRVTGIKKYGRGGVLALGSVLAKESGASRSSPILRGNWVVETLLGENLPRPPANVPKLPDEEPGANGLTVRQLTERHTRVAECAVCHQRIDPFGFALERYDAIGRFRAKDSGGRALDTRVRLKDGTTFDGIEGLRQYLLTKRRDDVLRQFCRKLLGYALGRAVTLSDGPLVDEMVGALKKNDYRVSAAVLAVVRSKQFRYHRGLAAARED